MEQGNTKHVPVMLERVLEVLALAPGHKLVDATLGGGGYTRAILEHIGPTGRLMAIDWDEEAIERFRERADGDVLLRDALETGRLSLVRAPYSRLADILREKGWDRVDRVVADLGLSSDQLADPKRGISFQEDGPLDMRLNTEETVEARHLVNGLSESELADLFRVYGDEGEAERIARAIVMKRKEAPIETTTALRELVWHNVVPARRKGRVHPATQVFQALRIAVNSEGRHLGQLLESLPEVLTRGGRAAIVSFHSGEDTLVKRLFQKEVRQANPRFALVTKKPLVPMAEEVRKNPRARSAKLRSIERL